MKYVLALIATFASGASLAAELDPNLALVKALAARPVAVVVGDRCEIRGAVWENGPKAGVDSALIDIQTGKPVFVRTNAQGVYSASVPYAGKPIVFQERIVSELIAPANVHVSIYDGAAVCDHRLQQTLSATHKEAK